MLVMTKITNLLIAAVMLSGLGQSSEREQVIIDDPGFGINYGSNLFAVTKAPSLLASDGQKLGVFGLDGQFRIMIDPGEDYFMANFAYLPNKGWYILCLVNKTLNGPNVWEVMIYDDVGVFIGNGYDSRTPQSKRLFFSQIYEINGSIVVNGLNMVDLPGDNALLQRLSIQRDGDRFIFEGRGAQFSRLSGETATKPEYRFRWPVVDDGRLFIVDELQPRTLLFDLKADNYPFLSDRPMNLPGRRSPFDGERIIRRAKTNPENLVQKLYNSSRATGFYRFGEGFLVGYTRPNPALFPGLEDGIRPNESTSPFILRLVCLNPSNMETVGSPLDFPSSFLMGTHEDEVFVFVPQKEIGGQPLVEVIQRVAFDKSE
jgi:hypothetical protein